MQCVAMHTQETETGKSWDSDQPGLHMDPSQSKVGGKKSQR